MLGAITPHVSKLKYLVGTNSSAILTGVGIAGTVGTAVLTGRASFKAARIIDAEKKDPNSPIGRILSIEETDKGIEAVGELSMGAQVRYLSKTEKLKLVWPHFIPPVVVGGLTITSIFVAHRIDAKKIAALAMATGVSERALQEYKEKVEAKLTDRQVQNINDEIAQDKVTKNPPGNQVVIIGSGEVLCMDEYSGRYFMSSVDAIKKAENDSCLNIIHFDNVSLASFYDEIGLPQTSQSSLVGWNHENRLVLVWSTAQTEDNRPCMVFSFENHPVVDYDKVR